MHVNECVCYTHVHILYMCGHCEHTCACVGVQAHICTFCIYAYVCMQVSVLCSRWGVGIMHAGACVGMTLCTLCPYISVLMELFVRVQCSHNMSVHCCECVCQQLSVAIHFYSLCRMKSLRSAPALKCRSPRPERCSHDFRETEPGGKDGVQGNTLI